MNNKWRAVEIKVCWQSIIHHRENFFSAIILLSRIYILATVYKNVFLPRMTMKITIKFDFTAFKCFSHHLFDGEALWEQFWTWINILSIQIMRTQAAPIVSNNNSIGIHHWNNFENKSLSESFRNFIIANKVLNETLDNEWAIAFTRMDSACKYYAFSFSNLILSALEISNDEHF